MTAETPSVERDPAGPRVSVVIPSFNSASIVGEAIVSVISQSNPADEIIVVDDGSADDTAAVCARYAPRVRFIRQQNAGASVARNTGAAASSGAWLAFLDADDIWDPAKLELQMAALAENLEADFAVSASLVWSPATTDYELHRWDGPVDPAKLRAELLVRNIFTGLCSSIVVRRAAFEAVGGFAPGRGSEDRRIAIDLLAAHRGLILPHPLVRQRPGPAHWTDPEKQRREMLRLMDDYGDLYKQLDPSGKLKRRALARMHDRTGMHYLENGDLRAAAGDLMHAAFLCPTLPNPWRVLINGLLGRLRLPRRRHAALARA